MTDEEQELSFEEILTTVMMNDEIIIVIPTEEVERVKTGLKNAKAKQAAKMKEDGLLPDPSNLSFLTFPYAPNEEEEQEGTYTQLKIILSRRGTIKVKEVIIPDGDF